MSNNSKNATETQTYSISEENGVFCGEDRISDYIEVVALSRTPESREWKKRIRFKDLDKKLCEIDIAHGTLLDSKESLRILADAGFSISCDRKKLMEYLTSATPKNRIVEIRRVGWINDKEFICPSFTISNATNDSFSLAGNIKECGFGKNGTLEDWQQNVCRLCEGNKILTLVLCVGLSGLLLKMLGLSCTIINLVGRSSIGKTTALHAAASLWGNPKFIQQWRSTSNALEAMAESHNDCLLILDELGQVTGKDVGNTVYMLGNSQGKKRLNANSELKKSKEWTISILSSGEIGIADKISETGERVKGGQLVRCIDIDCLMSDDLGIFDTLHDDIHSGAEFSRLLKGKASEYYGTAAEAFVTQFIASNIDLRERFNKLKQKLIADMHLENVDGQVGRVADVFVLYALTGELACDFGVFTHKPDELVKDIFKLFENWLNDRGTTRSYEEEEVKEHISNYLLQNDARFQSFDENYARSDKVYDAPRIINDCAGFKVEESHQTTYYINTNVFKKDFVKGFNYQLVRKILTNGDILKVDGRGKNPQIPNPLNDKRPRMVTLVFSKLSSERKETLEELDELYRKEEQPKVLRKMEVNDPELQKILSEGDVVTRFVANGEEAESYEAENTGGFDDPINESVPYNG